MLKKRPKYRPNTYNQACFAKSAIIFDYFILSKNHHEPPKVAQLAKNTPIWSP